MKRIYKREFTIVELICAIAIISILIIITIISVTKMIEDQNKASLLETEQLIKKATQNYIKSNPSRAPEVIGDVTYIKLSELKKEKYITENIKNNNNKNCMKESYVRVYKLDRLNYKYLTYLYCGNEKKPKVEEIPTPNIRLLFIDDKTITNNNSIFNDLKQTRLYLEIIGGNTFAGAPIEIENYIMSISMKTKKDKELKEYYNSGVIDISGNYTYELDKKLNYYVNAYDATTIVIKVRTMNSIGGIKETITKAELK